MDNWINYFSEIFVPQLILNTKQSHHQILKTIVDRDS
jgi:hypothetical protein